MKKALLFVVRISYGTYQNYVKLVRYHTLHAFKNVGQGQFFTICMSYPKYKLYIHISCSSRHFKVIVIVFRQRLPSFFPYESQCNVRNRNNLEKLSEYCAFKCHFIWHNRVSRIYRIAFRCKRSHYFFFRLFRPSIEKKRSWNMHVIRSQTLCRTSWKSLQRKARHSNPQSSSQYKFTIQRGSTK